MSAEESPAEATSWSFRESFGATVAMLEVYVRMPML
jgi:hypothetical protein